MTQQLNMQMPLTEELSLLHNTHVRWIAFAGPPAPGKGAGGGGSDTLVAPLASAPMCIDTHIHKM